MEFGLVLQCDPPASRLVDLARRAEAAGFHYVWTFDSHLLWQEPFVIYSQILAATSSIRVGPMVTNPLSRDWTVTASLFATLNDMYGNRTICGIGRGDSAVRVAGGSPASLATLERAMTVIKTLAEGGTITENGTELKIPWVREGELEIWMAAYGPKALELAGRTADGCIIQLADPPLVEWCAGLAREALRAASRPDDAFTVCAAAPAYVGEDLDHQRDQLRWFGGMVGNHVASLVKRYGERSEVLPRALTDYVATRPPYDYAHHGRAGNESAEFVTDDVVERFCLLGPAESHVERLSALAASGVQHFALYLMHDQAEATLDAYGDLVIPRLG